MAISRVLGASLLSNLDRQGIDLQFSSSGNALVYMDFANFYVGIGTAAPTHDLTVLGQTKLSNLIIVNNQLTSETGIVDLGSNANITITGGTLNSVLTTDGSGNLFWAESLANVIFTGNSSFSVIEANLIYEEGSRVLTSNSEITINGSVIGSGTSSNIYVTLANTGVTPGIYGAGDDEYADKIPKITVGVDGRITSIANVTLTQVGNVTFTDTTISTASGNIIFDSNGGNISAGGSRISNVADPINLTDVPNKAYVDSLVTASAVRITLDNTSVNITDDGSNAGIISTSVDGVFLSNITVDGVEYYTRVNIGNLSINDRTISSAGNIILDAEGDGTVQFAGTDAVWLPTGDNVDRPTDPEIGYFRYNTEQRSIEFWDGEVWSVPGQAVVTSDVINPDGASNVYTLSSNATSAGVFVNINGTLQQPGTAYDIVNNNQIQFTEIPLTTDIVEVRHVGFGGVSISQLAYGNTKVILDASAVNVTGNLLPSANITYSLGSETLWWKDLYLSGNTIYIGGTELTISDGQLFVSGAEVLRGLESNVLVLESSVTTLTANAAVQSGLLADLVSNAAVQAGAIADTISSVTTANVAMKGYVDNATDLDNLLPSGEQTGYVLKTSGAGTYYWSAESGGGSVVGQELTTLRQSNTATSGQTIFTLVDGKTYTPGAGQLRVYINGVRQFPDAYTETSANVYTLSTGVTAGTVVFAEIDQFSSFNNYANLTYASNIGNISAVGLTVQSAIENLETNKATLADPVFTGTPTAPTASSGTDTTQIATTAFVQTANVALKGYTDTQLATKANLANPTFSGNITVSGNVKFTGWHVYEANNTLYFAFGGAVKMSLNTSGNLTVSGDVTGFGTP